MHYLELAHEAQLHREAYIALLDGLLQSTAAKRHFAQRVGITPQYLSYLLNPFDRTPGPDLARKMVDALPLDVTARDPLLQHLLLSSERRLQAHRTAQQEFPQVNLATHMALIQQAQTAANFAQHPEQAKAQQQALQATGALLLQQMSPMCYPLDYAQLCLWLHSVESARDLHANAIYHAKKARAVLGNFVRTDFGPAERERFADLAFHALRLEAVTYYNLKVARAAYDLCCAGEALPEVKQRPQTWLPHLYRDKINAYAELPRFSIRAAEAWAHHGKQLCEQIAHDEAPLWALMLDRSLARAYLRYGNVKKAMVLLQPFVEQVNRLPLVGVLHRVSFLRVYAEALWLSGERQAWESVIASTLHLASSAGLTHQIAEIKKRYGASVEWVAGVAGEK
ncbi:MAG: hypothetical protein R3E79_13155 [Caldilineaceae bacterium]